MTGLVSCVVHWLQLFEQLEFCGYLVTVSVSSHPRASLKPSHDGVLGTLINLLLNPVRGLVDLLGVLVDALLQRCLSEALDDSNDRVNFTYLIFSDGVS